MASNMQIVDRPIHGGYSYNAELSYSGGDFSVNVIEFSYPWELASSGTAKGRQAQTIYPWRVVQGNLAVKLQFRDVNEYRDFAEYVRGYHLAATQGNSMPKMTFSSSVIGTGGISYQVIIPSVQQQYQFNMAPAPTISLTLTIVKDMIDTGDTSSSSMTGSETDLTDSYKATDSDVASSGDSAFQENGTS